MDKATLIGLVLGFAAIIGGQILEGGSLHSIMQFTAAIIVLGGTFGAVFVSYPFQDVMEGFRGIRKVLKEPAQDPFQMIQQIITYANKARREGILSLEKEIKSIKDPFLVKALTMSVDGIEPHLIREAMEAYRDSRIRPRPSLKELKPLSLGKVINRLRPGDDLLKEMLDA